MNAMGDSIEFKLGIPRGRIIGIQKIHLLLSVF